MGSVNYSVANQIGVLSFTGQSKYAADFQNVLAKAVQLDSIQLSGLDDRANNDQNRLGALQSLDQSFAALQAAITNLSTAIGPAALSATVSNPALASVSLGTGATAGSYQLEVDSLGASTQMLSSSSNSLVTDPNSQNIAPGTTFELAVTDPSSNGGQTQYATINNPSGTLTGLMQAINSTPGLGVSASIVNVGPPSSPDYRLAIQSTALGPVTIGLGVGSSQTFSNILTVISTGANSSYQVAGTAVSGTSDTITLAPGVTVNLLQASVGNPTTITVSQSTSNAASGLQQFASAYNQVVAQLGAQHGQNAGALSGDSILLEAQSVLSAINGYNANGSTLSSIGLDLDSTGHLTFNASEFALGLGGDFSSLSQFLGGSTTGFIGSATASVQTLEDPNRGTLKSAENSISKDLATVTAKITDQINQINQFQQNLYNQLAASDAAIFSLTQQQTFFTQLFQTQTANLMGRA
ncbi:MAG TPA: flagellar filament capping protein FliD [Bryobacteraceae bacterium]|jgi:flagellar hook-associated protein 2